MSHDREVSDVGAGPATPRQAICGVQEHVCKPVHYALQDHATLHHVAGGGGAPAALDYVFEEHVLEEGGALTHPVTRLQQRVQFQRVPQEMCRTQL